MGKRNSYVPNKIEYNTIERPNKPESLRQPQLLVAVVGLDALPGTSQNVLSNNQIKDIAVDEAKRLYNAGIKTIMLQNVNDLPMKKKVDVQIIAYMSAIGHAIRSELPDDCVLGVSVLKNDGAALVAVASAMEADFIRPKIYVGGMMSVSGYEKGCVDEVLEMRYLLKSNVQIWPDVHDRSGVKVGDVSIVDACEQAMVYGLGDALMITGKNFEHTIELVKDVKKHLPQSYVIIGGGANTQNLQTAFKHADGVCVASCLKATGSMTGRLDDNRLTEFMRAYNEAVMSLKK